MEILELTKKVKASAAKRTLEEKIKLLKSAHILDRKGQLNRDFFSVYSEPAKSLKKRPVSLVDKTASTSSKSKSSIKSFAN